MTEIRFHGRGGQGAVVASEILATAFFKEGRFVQAFPTFGVERRGAPVAAFLRLDSKPIRLRCQIERPHHVVILDSTLIPVLDVTAGLRQGGWVLVNSEHSPDHFAQLVADNGRVATVDASGIAGQHQLGSRTNPIVNTSILGAFARCTELVKLDSVLESIREGVPVLPDANARAAEEAYEQVLLSKSRVGV